MYTISKDVFLQACRETKTWAECAEILGISRSTALAWKKKYGVPDRTTKSSCCPPKPTTEQLEILTGSMLGDGSLTKRYKMNSMFVERHCEQQIGYLRWKFEKLKPFSRTIIREVIDGSRLPKTGSRPNYISYRMETVRHPFFSAMEKLWYKRDDSGAYITDHKKRRIKVVPTDLCLTELSFAVWFLDDGRMIHPRRTGVISTDGFSKAGCENLQNKLACLGIKAGVTKSKKNRWEISISKKSYDLTCDILRSYAACDCMSYKYERRQTNP
jgi:hypothetical protein